VKQRLANAQQYQDFLKCLNLFSQGIITRIELVLLVKDLIGKYKDLYDWFKNFIGFDDSQLEFLEKEREEKEKPLPGATSHAEIDFKTCKRYGPSYRALPKNVNVTSNINTHLTVHSPRLLWS
jgi:paired amphipathic helix protein Sin3a